MSTYPSPSSQLSLYLPIHLHRHNNHYVYLSISIVTVIIMSTYPSPSSQLSLWLPMHLHRHSYHYVYLSICILLGECLMCKEPPHQQEVVSFTRFLCGDISHIAIIILYYSCICINSSICNIINNNYAAIIHLI